MMVNLDGYMPILVLAFGFYEIYFSIVEKWVLSRLLEMRYPAIGRL
jgi:hypothetical protein